MYKSLSGKPSFAADVEATGQVLVAMFASVPGDLDGDGIPDESRRILWTVERLLARAGSISFPARTAIVCSL